MQGQDPGMSGWGSERLAPSPKSPAIAWQPRLDAWESGIGILEGSFLAACPAAAAAPRRLAKDMHGATQAICHLLISRHWGQDRKGGACHHAGGLPCQPDPPPRWAGLQSPCSLAWLTDSTLS